MALSRQVQSIMAVKSLKLVCFLLLTTACGATRPVCQDKSKHIANRSAPQVSVARTLGSGSAAAQLHQESNDPDDPKTQEEVDNAAAALQDTLKDQGTLDESIKGANEEATQLLARATEFSTLAKGIEEKTKTVTEKAAETDKKMQEAHIKVKDNAEAKITEIATNIHNEAMQDQAAHKQHVENKGQGSSLLSNGPFEAGAGDKRGKRHGDPGNEQEIAELIQNLNDKFDNLKELITDSHDKAQVAKDSAEVWATKPMQAFKEGAEFARSKAKEVVQDMSNRNKQVKEEVEGHVKAVLAAHNEDKTVKKKEVKEMTEMS